MLERESKRKIDRRQRAKSVSVSIFWWAISFVSQLHHQISWNHFLLNLLAKIIVLGSFNLNYLLKEKNYGVILMGVILHLMMSRLCLSGKLRMLGLWPRSLARLNLTLFSIWGLIKLLLLCGIISTRFTIKTTLLGVFNWSMRWLISHKEVSQLRNIFLAFKLS